MKKRWVFTGILAMLLLTLVVPNYAFSKSRENKEACIKWCKANQPECVKCHANTTCGGRSWKVIKSFKKGTGNWYACGLSDYGRESRKNKTDCDAWCKQDNRCEYCKDNVGCGADYTAVKKFGGPGGKNWYACAKRDKLSQINKQKCIQWCHAHKDDRWPLDPCIKCSTAVGCGKGFKVLKRFTGKGDNWHACAFKDSRRQCEAYCEKNKPECKFCSANPGCGAGYTSMKTFRGLTVDQMTNAQLADRNTNVFTHIGDALEYLKKNWYACKKK
jgi:hypothetical protein